MTDYEDFRNFKDGVVREAGEREYYEVFDEFESRFGEKLEIDEQVEKLEEVLFSWKGW